ncbi:hypothetical protein, partial [Microcoleus sp. herbarium19]
MGHVPKSGETVHWHEFILTVECMDGVRIEQ